METYYLMTRKPRSALPRIFHEREEFIWHPHRTYDNVWVIQTIFTQNAMFNRIYALGSSMSPSEDILLEKIGGLNRVHPDSLGTIYLNE